MEEEIRKLQNALNVTMNPLVDGASRSEAFKYIENLKSTSENLAQIGMVLAHKNNDQICRHFGLHLVEDCVKFGWNKMSMDEKQFIKENVMELITSGTHDITSEESHIKDALSRIIVEMAKREWPQQWVSMISEFYQLASVGPIQEEIVLLSLLRLAEDSYVLHKLPSARRRDVLLGFSSVIDELTTFFSETLNKYMKLFAQAQNHSTITTSIKLIQRCCDVITVFADVIQMSNLTATLVPSLVEGLQHEPIRLLTADSLLEIVSKKCGKTEERISLLQHFLSSSTLHQLHHLASSSAADLSDESKSMFFKKLCQIVVTCGTQLCFLLKGGVTPPPIDLTSFITILLSFTIHPHQVISSYCLPLWLNLLKHDVITSQPITEECCMSILRSSLALLNKDSAEALNMGKMEFEDEAEFHAFFTRYRVEYGDVLKVISLRHQSPSLDFISRQLYDLVDANQATTESYKRWELVVVVFEYLMAKWDFMDTIEPPLIQSALSLFNRLLQYQSSDATIGSSQMTCISVLLPLLHLQHHLFPVVVNKLFSYICFEDPTTPLTTTTPLPMVRSREVMNIRRHGCAAFIRFCKMFAEVLSKDFPQMRTQVMRMTSQGLSQGEKVACYEALMITSNHLPDDQQISFLHDVMTPVNQYWLSNDVTCTLDSADRLMEYIGLMAGGVVNDETAANRAQINLSLLMMLAVLKRCTKPHVSNILEPLMHNVFCLIRSYHSIFSPQNFSKIHPSFVPSFDLPTSDKARFLGMSRSQEEVKEKSGVERMKLFLSGLAEMTYSILGQCCMNGSLYNIQQLQHFILNYNFHNIFSLPHITIKNNLHHFYRHFTKHCPPSSYSTLISVVSTISPFFFHFLNTLWQDLNTRQSHRLNPDLDGDVIPGEDRGEEEELIGDQLLIEVTKEYLDSISNLLREKKHPQQHSTSTNDSTTNDNTTSNNNDNIVDMMMDDDDGAVKKADVSISGLGQMLLCQENTHIEMVLFSCLTWCDTSVCLKALPLCLPTLQFLHNKGMLTASLSEEYYKCMLTCLNIHGQHEVVLFVLINVLLQIYELLRHRFPVIPSLIISISGVSKQELSEFDRKLGQKGTKGFEKKKRDVFRSMLQGAIGKSVGERHKKHVHIKNLTPFRLFKERQDKIMGDFGLCSLFQEDDV